jgi:hypothetical protein
VPIRPAAWSVRRSQAKVPLPHGRESVRMVRGDRAGSRDEGNRGPGEQGSWGGGVKLSGGLAGRGLSGIIRGELGWRAGAA